MRIKILAVTAVLSLCGPLLNAEPEPCLVDHEHNRFTEISTYSTSAALSIGNPIYTFFQSAVRKTGEIDILRFVLVRSAGRGSLKYNNCSTVSVLVDGQREDLSFHYNINTSSGAFEIFSADISLATLLRMSSAERVEFRICNDEFTVPSGVLCTGRDIYSRIKGSL